jgi:biopolymer transport protein ExbD
MARASRSNRNREVPELNITAFMNLMVVLVPFLLISAVFSQVTILQLNLPAASTSKADKKKFNLEIVVRSNRLEVRSGNKLIKNVARKEDGYDIRTLARVLMPIKKRYPEKKDATLLMEPDIKYDALVQVMDAVGTAEVIEGLDSRKIELFPEISIGDARSSGRKR